MTLAELREEFKSSSGFLHWTNAEIDKALNKGMRFLDKKCYSNKKNSNIYRTLEIGSNRVLFGQAFFLVKDVWLMDDIKRERLSKTTLEEIREHDFTSGRPTHYLPVPMRTFSNYGDYFQVPGVFADVVVMENVDGLAFNRVADKVYYVEIAGRFFTEPLTDTFNENWWTVNYSELLLQATIYLLDARYRNSSGGAELLGIINEALREIHNDDVEEELEGINMVMEG